MLTTTTNVGKVNDETCQTLTVDHMGTMQELQGSFSRWAGSEQGVDLWPHAPRLNKLSGHCSGSPVLLWPGSAFQHLLGHTAEGGTTRTGHLHVCCINGNNPSAVICVWCNMIHTTLTPPINHHRGWHKETAMGCRHGQWWAPWFWRWCALPVMAPPLISPFWAGKFVWLASHLLMKVMWIKQLQLWTLWLRKSWIKLK